MGEHATAAAPKGTRALVVLTALATPLGLGVEALFQSFVFSEDFESMRNILAPTLTGAAWVLAIATVFAASLAGRVYAVFFARALTRLEARGAFDGPRVASARLGAFLLASSAVQAPSLLSIVAFAGGADLLPVLIAAFAATLGVILQARALRSCGVASA